MEKGKEKGRQGEEDGGKKQCEEVLRQMHWYLFNNKDVEAM